MYSFPNFSYIVVLWGSKYRSSSWALALGLASVVFGVYNFKLVTFVVADLIIYKSTIWSKPMIRIGSRLSNQAIEKLLNPLNRL